MPFTYTRTNGHHRLTTIHGTFVGRSLSAVCRQAIAAERRAAMKVVA